MNIQYPRQQAGVTLIEILVAVLVLSIGALSMSALQLRSVKTNQEALQYSMAVIQAHSISDAIYVARQKALDGEFNIALNEQVPTKNLNFVYTNLYNWRQSIKALLGQQASGAVNCIDTICTITVKWHEDKNSLEYNQNQPEESTHTPKMVKLEVKP